MVQELLWPNCNYGDFNLKLPKCSRNCRKSLSVDSIWLGKSIVQKNVVNGLTTLVQNDIGFSQTRSKQQRTFINDLVDGVERNGFISEPRKSEYMDVVRMPDGKLTSLDRTRPLAARRAGIRDEARVFNFDDPLPDDLDYVARFLGSKGEVPKTFGEAALNRIGKQESRLVKAHPFGSPIIGSQS